MHGYQITFFTQQDRLHEGEPLAQWLVAQAQLLGIRGATLNGALEGFGRHRELHALQLFDAAGQPVQVTLVLLADEAERLFAHLHRAAVQVFYTKSSVEFGTLGD